MGNRRGLLATAFAVILCGSTMADNTPTFTKDIAPIFQERCQACHRPGQIGPMSLLTYEQARPWAKSIRDKVSSRSMPPWFAASGVRAYVDDPSLTDAQIAVIVKWVDAGAPEGDLKDLPAAREFRDGWQLGDPDVVMGMDESYPVAAEGDDEYRCFCMDPKLEQDKWISSVEVVPGDQTVAHHVVLYIDKTGDVSAKLDANDPGPGYSCFGGPGFAGEFFGGWAPGSVPEVYADGVGFLAPAGAKIVMQMHYHKKGKATSDQTKVGLHFSDESSLKPIHNGIIFGSVDIPAGAAEHVVMANSTLKNDIVVVGIAPHMHLLGKAMDIWAELPGGQRIDLVKVPKYDFYWQRQYQLVEPLALPKGTQMKLRAEFDNSATAPYQPSNPPRRVTFGEQTTDEMCIGVFYHYNAVQTTD